MNVARARYEYRSLKVSIWDKHMGYAKQRHGSSADRVLIISEPNPVEKDIRITDNDGDDRGDFELHAFAALVDHFNKLGSEGWRLQEFTPNSPHGYFAWPEGVHFFVRETV